MRPPGELYRSPDIGFATLSPLIPGVTVGVLETAEAQCVDRLADDGRARSGCVCGGVLIEKRDIPLRQAQTHLHEQILNRLITVNALLDVRET